MKLNSSDTRQHHTSRIQGDGGIDGDGRANCSESDSGFISWLVGLAGCQRKPASGQQASQCMWVCPRSPPRWSGGGKDRYRRLVLTSKELMPFGPFRLFLKKDLLLIFFKLYVGVYICMWACAHKSRYPRMPGADT